MKYEPMKMTVTHDGSGSFPWRARATITIMDQKIEESSSICMTAIGAIRSVRQSMRKQIRRQIRGKI